MDVGKQSSLDWKGIASLGYEKISDRFLLWVLTKIGKLGLIL